MTAGVEDPGLQPERTSLSWVRTSMSVVVVALLFLRWYPYYGSVVFLPAAVAFCFSLFVRLRSVPSYQRGAFAVNADVRRTRGEGAARSRASASATTEPGWVIALCAGVVAVAGCAMWLIVQVG